MLNKETHGTYNAIVDAVCYWLGYQFKIGRDKLIHEASLRYPIADTITAKGIAINRLILEKNHPVFKSRSIDLVAYASSVEEPEEEKDDTNLIDVFEFKIAKKVTGDIYGSEHQRVFDDIARLAYYNLWRNKDCYFLICGKYADFKNYFVGQRIDVNEDADGKIKIPGTETKSINNTATWEAKGLYADWFSFNVDEEKTKLFSINEPTDGKDWGLSVFQKNYIIREQLNKVYSNQIAIKTKCMAITAPGLEKTRTHAAGIWKIEGI
jgi:hypothetical protein